jgi:hypothetical protein
VTRLGAFSGAPQWTTLDETLCKLAEQVAERMGREAELRPRNKPKINLNGIKELVTDNGYRSTTAALTRPSNFFPALVKRTA